MEYIYHFIAEDLEVIFVRDPDQTIDISLENMRPAIHHRAKHNFIDTLATSDTDQIS